MYAAAAVLGDGWGPRHQLYFAWETSIPLVPWLAPVYMSVDLMPFFALGRPLRPLLLALTLELAIAVLIFWLYPLEDGFRDPPVTGMLAWVRAVTLRHNYCPSLHVALAFTLAQQIGRPYAWWWALAIAISTLFLHAHHLVDVVAGVALSGIFQIVTVQSRNTYRGRNPS